MSARWAEGGEAGFTLAEMLVVLAVVALVVVAGALSLSGGRPGRLVAATAEALTAELSRTRLDAIRSGRMRRLSFSADGRAFAREGAAPHAIPEGVRIDLVTAREARGGGDAAAVGFLPDGRSTGGRLVVRMAEARRAVAVDWLTGAVREAAP